MLLNLILVGALFVCGQKLKLKPYHIGLLFGGVKMLIYLFFPGSVGVAVIAGVVMGLFAFGTAFFLDRIDRKKVPVDPAKLYGSRNRGGSFQWAYVPLTICVVFMVFGEWLL